MGHSGNGDEEHIEGDPREGSWIQIQNDILDRFALDFVEGDHKAQLHLNLDICHFFFSLPPPGGLSKRERI